MERHFFITNQNNKKKIQYNHVNRFKKNLSLSNQFLNYFILVYKNDKWTVMESIQALMINIILRSTESFYSTAQIY